MFARNFADVLFVERICFCGLVLKSSLQNLKVVEAEKLIRFH
jgi:hypothetical protein